jgi:2,4-dienoyl-CoA reductase-like NADH-dependent reductase (Old Yellow Enzyme family)
MSKLFSPISLGPLQLENRIAIAPMCQYSADGKGLATDWHMIHLGHLALSGAGLLIIEATAVTEEGRISPDDLGLWSDAHTAALKPVIDAIRRYSPIKVAIQLGHAGRKAGRPWRHQASRMHKARRCRPRWTRPASHASRMGSCRPRAAPTNWAWTPSSCTAPMAT